MKALQQSIVQLPRDPRALVDAPFQQRFLGPLSVLDIGAGAIPPQDASVLIPQRIVSDQELAILPVFSLYSCLHLNRCTVGTRPFTSDIQLLQILRMKDSGNGVL